MGLLGVFGKRKQEEPSQLIAFLATFTWVNTWLFFPFLTFGAIWLRFGVVPAGLFWGGLGFLAPSLKQHDGMREFIAQMRFWIDGAEIVGEAASGGKPALHCHHPHGAAGINGCSKGGLDLRIRAVVAPLCFRLPLCRQLMESLGAISSARHAFQRYMRSGKDFAVIPGGVEEVVLVDPKHERVFLKKRKGFVKYALEFGYDLIPVYHFGETQLFDIVWPLGEPWLLRLRLKIAERTQIALGIGLGWRWMPNLPKPGVKCITVIGERIVLPKVEKPSAEEVDKYHAMYTAKLLELYNAHRHRLPEYASKELEIW